MVTTALKSFSWCEGMVRAVCEVDRDFPEYLLTQSMAERQMMVIIFLACGDKSAKKTSLSVLGRQIRTENKKALLRKFVRNCPKGLFGVMGKVGGRIMAKERYHDLVDLLQEPAAATFLRHVERIKPRTIYVLKSLEPVYRTRAIVNVLANGEDLRSFKYAIAVAKRFNSEIKDRDIARSLDQSLSDHRPTRDSVFDVADWLKQQLKKHGIPKPPWRGTRELKPVTTVGEIRKVGKEFKNCIEGQLSEVVVGNRHFYVYRGRVAAVVSLERDPALGWVVGDVLGKGNKSIPKEIRMEIVDLFGDVGFGPCQGWENVGMNW